MCRSMIIGKFLIHMYVCILYVCRYIYIHINRERDFLIRKISKHQPFNNIFSSTPVTVIFPWHVFSFSLCIRYNPESETTEKEDNE